VYKGIAKLGYDKLQVKGDLGVATTLDDGKGRVVDAQMEAAVNKTVNKAMKPFLSEVAKHKKRADKAGKSLVTAFEMVKKLKQAHKQAQESLKVSDNPKKEALMKQLDAKLERAAKDAKKANAESQKANAALETAQKKRDAALEKVAEKVGLKPEDIKKQGKAYEPEAIDDLVGTFGPETI